MKEIKLVYIIAIFSLIFVQCTKETEGISEPTSVVQFVRIGNGVELIGQGEEYADAGALAYYVVQKTEIDFDTIEVEAEVVTTLDSSLPGAYTVSYKAVNPDGIEFYSGSDASRKIVVVSAEDKVSGEYEILLCDRDGTDLTADVTTVVLYELYRNEEMVVYDYSDWIAGWYNEAYGYGSRYAFGGRLGITNDNKVVHLSSSNPWGIPGDLDPAATNTFDPTTNMIKYVYAWTAGYNFTIEIQKL